VRERRRSSVWRSEQRKATSGDQQGTRRCDFSSVISTALSSEQGHSPIALSQKFQPLLIPVSASQQVDRPKQIL